MGLFSGVRNAFKMSEAAVVVQNLLEQRSKVGMFDLNPAEYAQEVVSKVWMYQREAFDGKSGQRPHKISTAAVALAFGHKVMDEGDRVNRMAVLMSLGTLLAEVERNGHLYPFNRLDEQLLGGAANTFAEASSELEPELEAAQRIMTGNVAGA